MMTSRALEMTADWAVDGAMQHEEHQDFQTSRSLRDSNFSPARQNWPFPNRHALGASSRLAKLHGEKTKQLGLRLFGGGTIVLQPHPINARATREARVVERVVGAREDDELQFRNAARLCICQASAVGRGSDVVAVADDDKRREYQPCPRLIGAGRIERRRGFEFRALRQHE